MLRPNLSIAVLLSALAVLAAVGCGDDELGGSHPNYERALAGSPPPLAALHEQSNDLLPGGIGAYEKRIARLRGYPVVVNLWASWCGPCRFEFPALQELSARYGKRVAFLGVDVEDSEDLAQSFLEEEPVPYPSVTDPDKEIFKDVGARVLPSTAFYDPNGELLFLKQGQYASEEDIRADIERCALGRPPGCESG